MCEFVIRPPEEKDIPALRDLYLETRKSTFEWLHSETMALQDFDRDTQGERILCAYLKEKPVGFLSYWEADRFIHCLYIHPSFQKRGIGRQLLMQAVLQFGTPLTLKCLKQNRSALHFYHSLGWQIAGQGICEDGPWYLLQYGE